VTLPVGEMLATLRETSGHAYGVIVSGSATGGAAPIPVEFGMMMAAVAGPGIEKRWRQHKIDAVVDVVKVWMSELFAGLTDAVDFLPYAATADADVELPLSWSSGESIGVVGIKMSKGKKLGTYQKKLLKVTTEILHVAIKEVEAMHIGGKNAWMEGSDMQSAASAVRMLLPHKLLEHARKQLGKMDVKDAIGELKSYKSPPEVVFKVMKAVLVLLDRKAKALPEWKEVRAEITIKLVDECLAMDASAKSKKEKWVDSKKCVKGLDTEEVFTKGSLPVQHFFEWLDICFLVRKVSKDLRKKDKEEAAADDEEEEEEEEEEE